MRRPCNAGPRALRALNPLPDHDDDLLPAGSRSERTAALFATVQELTGAPCRLCAAPLCGHEAVLAVLLGSKRAPRCAACAAAELREGRGELCARSQQWIVRRECFHDAWRQASEQEGFGATDRPPCLFDSAAPLAPAGASPAAASATTAPTADLVHDAGDLGCGDLVLQLRFELADLPPGTVLEVRATDPAAPVDLPAWCGLVGHTLLHASPPRYWIRRKGPS